MSESEVTIVTRRPGEYKRIFEERVKNEITILPQSAKILLVKRKDKQVKIYWKI